MNNDQDPALAPPRILVAKDLGQRHQIRQWQGIPGIEQIPDGTLYCTFYSGGPDEGPGNFILLLASKDQGRTWNQDPVLCLDAGDQVRCFDPCLWRDPGDHLWLFWSQSCPPPSGGIFAGPVFYWGLRFVSGPGGLEINQMPRCLCEGVMLNKPLVRSDGTWLFAGSSFDHIGLEGDRSPRTTVLLSENQGQTFRPCGSVEVPGRDFDEAMIIEQQDQRLRLLVRTRYGIGQSFSPDGGNTWSQAEDSLLGGPCSRFFIRRLRSGRLLLVNHADFINQGYESFVRCKGWCNEAYIQWALRRSNMTALLSDDDGRTWPYRLLLDGRERVSYPDAIQAPDDRLRIVYDRDRYGAGEILLADITEADILAGRLVDGQSRLQQVITRL